MRKLVLLLLVCASAAAHAARFYEQAELDALLAPVAMYPDPLLSSRRRTSTSRLR